MTASITVVGLGSGNEDQISLGIWKRLSKAETVYLRTRQHPVVHLLDEYRLHYESFDGMYEQKDSFLEVYENIAQELVRMAEKDGKEIVYAVPGHPMVAEKSVLLLKNLCAERGLELQIYGGESFLDQAFLRLGFDPIEGFQLLDGTSLERLQLQPALHTLIAQVYDTSVASDVKLTLMELYPDEYSVVVAHSLGVDGDEQILRIPLHELDRLNGYGNLSLVWIPKTDAETVTNRTFSRLEEIVRILRSPGGCPWDREQTHQSIRKNLIEETYEVLETIDDDDPEAMCEELGDLLLQVMLHSQMEAETGIFSVWDVVETLNRKLIRRHPHVFADRSADNAEEALENWEEIKAKEKLDRSVGEPVPASVLSGVPRDLPGLMKALKIQKKAAQVGFDWAHPEDVADKISEELKEFMELADVSDSDMEQRRREEMGDLLFAVVNLARYFKIDPEEAMVLTIRKFIRRFSFIEEQLRIKGKDFGQTDLLEMEQWWQEAKLYEK